MAAHPDDTTSPDASNPSLTRAYAGRIEARQTSRWRKYLGVQLPYRLHLRRQHLGFVLDVGCGVGRNLVHLEGSGIGVDANAACVDACRQRGLRAYIPDEFHEQARRERWRFDAMLVAHVLEHVGVEGAIDLLRSYRDYIEPGGRVMLITPQEAGYASDATHVEFIDDRKLRQVCGAVGLDVTRSYSFPFPRLAGRVFAYNEFIVLARVPWSA